MATPEDPSESTFRVACLCAEWCGVCREWRPAFEEQARAHPGLRFDWVDVEDEADAMGDVDIETFPTLLVARGSEPLFLGAIPPSGPGLARLIASLQAQPGPAPGLDSEAAPLLRRLQARVLR
ncbi:MAG: thiol reductase thioredoxin [Ramlibacter sp.]|nr:thiol reductase thioredoxin [Ramlibacter sp.]